MWVVYSFIYLFIFYKVILSFLSLSLCLCHRLKFQSNPTLKYLYPPPSNSILANITHALMSVPKFYVQVSHSCFSHVVKLPSSAAHHWYADVLFFFICLCIRVSSLAVVLYIDLYVKKKIRCCVTFSVKLKYCWGLSVFNDIWTTSNVSKIKWQTFSF